MWTRSETKISKFQQAVQFMPIYVRQNSRAIIVKQNYARGDKSFHIFFTPELLIRRMQYFFSILNEQDFNLHLNFVQIINSP